MSEEQYVRVNLQPSTLYKNMSAADGGLSANISDPGLSRVFSDALPQIESCKLCVTQMQLSLKDIPVGYMQVHAQPDYTDPVYVPTTTEADGIEGMNKGSHSLGLELEGQVGVTFNPLNAVPDKTFGPNDFHQRDKLYNADDAAPVNEHYYDTGKIYQEHLTWFKDFGTTEMYRMRVNAFDEFDPLVTFHTDNKRLNDMALESSDNKYPFMSEGDILSCLSDAFTGALLINRKPSNANPAVLHLGLPEQVGVLQPGSDEVVLADMFKNKIEPGNLYIPPRVSFFIDENDCIGFTFSPGFASITEVINDHIQGEDASDTSTDDITHFTATSTTVARKITEAASLHPTAGNNPREIPTNVSESIDMRQVCKNIIASPIPYYAEEQAHVSLFTPGADIDKIRQSSMGSTITVAGVSRLNVEGSASYVPQQQVTLENWWTNSTVNTTLSHPDQTFLERFYFTVNKHVTNLIPGLPWIPILASGNLTTPDMKIDGYVDGGGYFPNNAYVLDTTKARMTAELPVISPSWAYGIGENAATATLNNVVCRRLAYMLSLVKYRFVFPTVKSCALNSIHSFFVTLSNQTTIGESIDDQGQTVVENLESPGEICKSEYFREDHNDITIASFPFSDKEKMKHYTYFTIDRPYEESRACICDPRYVFEYYNPSTHANVPRRLTIKALYHTESSPDVTFRNRVLTFNVQLTFRLKLAYL